MFQASRLVSVITRVWIINPVFNHIKLEDKYINNQIDHEAYQRMRPIYQKELQQFKAEANSLKEVDNNKMEYVTSAVNIVQSARRYYVNSTTVALKQTFIGSLFSPSILIENLNYRTAEESTIIAVLRGFKPVLNEKGHSNEYPFPYSSPNGNRTRVTRMKIWCPNP
jgi:hypothetical protein